MNKLRLLEEKIGGWWTGIKFHYDGAPEAERKRKPMRFCEAVKESRTRPVILNPDLVDCPGALRVWAGQTKTTRPWPLLWPKKRAWRWRPRAN